MFIIIVNKAIIHDFDFKYEIIIDFIKAKE
jgi:hypothetical protein